MQVPSGCGSLLTPLSVSLPYDDDRGYGNGSSACLLFCLFNSPIFFCVCVCQPVSQLWPDAAEVLILLATASESVDVASSPLPGLHVRREPVGA